MLHVDQFKIRQQHRLAIATTTIFTTKTQSVNLIIYIPFSAINFLSKLKAN